MSEEPPDRGAPDGATCRVHPERPAFAMCPKCGAGACLVCWHVGIERCHRCLLEHPEEIAEAPPWERASLPWPRRFVATLAAAFGTSRLVPGFARGDVRPAATFFALTFVPLALVEGVVPYTHTLQFGALEVTVLGDARATDIALDVVRAAGFALALDLVFLLALALPFVSLARAFGDPSRKNAPVRTILYRAWLLPFGKALLSLVAFVATSESAPALQPVAWLAAQVPIFLLLLTMRSSARLASGTGPFAALWAVLVPFALLAATESLASHLLAPYLPAAPPVSAGAVPEPS